MSTNQNLHPPEHLLIAALDLGVGTGMSPPQYLVPGTEMEVQISKIGTLRNVVEFAT